MMGIQIGGAHLPCSVSILDTDDEPSFIFGLDMLRRHQCCIDLAANVLAVGTTGERVAFLPESEIPRGKGAFPSVALMTSIPAKVAGVEDICIVTPPGPDGKIDDAGTLRDEHAHSRKHERGTHRNNGSNINT